MITEDRHNVNQSLLKGPSATAPSKSKHTKQSDERNYARSCTEHFYFRLTPLNKKDVGPQT